VAADSLSGICAPAPSAPGSVLWVSLWACVDCRRWACGQRGLRSRRRPPRRAVGTMCMRARWERRTDQRACRPTPQRREM